MAGPNNGQAFPVSGVTGREALLFRTTDTLITIQACAGNLHVSLALGCLIASTALIPCVLSPSMSPS